MVINENEVISRYLIDEKSTTEIAKEYNSHPNSIRRILLKNKVKLRDKSEAQAISLKNGTSKHPTKNKKRSQAVKDLISEKNTQRWKEKTKEQKEKISEKARKRWDNLTEKQKEKIRIAANEAIRSAALEGSKLEKFIFLGLQDAKFDAIIHHEWLFKNRKTHLDILLPKVGYAIEIDGPSHFIPIWGQEELDKTIESDNKKRGMLLESGLSVIRVKQFSKTISQKKEKDLLKKILDIVSNIQTENYFEIEV